MSGRILVLGAAGRLGYAAAEAFRDAGWSVRGLVRPKRAYAVPYGVEAVEALTRDEAIAAAGGCDVVLNALNPIITKWQQNAMPLVYSAIAAAESNRATLIFAGNVWNYGRNMPPLLDENTPQLATARKGRMRVEMELRIREACERGMRAIILRAGDFFGGGRGSWFDLVIVKELLRGRITYPGPLHAVHTWAYLPDFAATLVRLAALRAQLPSFETFGFAGHAVTGHELIAAVERATGRKYNVRQMGWWFLKSFGRLMAIGRELAELEYLWRVPHRIDGTKLAALLGDVPHTPLDRAVAQALRELGYGVPHNAELAAQA
jgi:nucleoside-diphosphate-sugar epimerase